MRIFKLLSNFILTKLILEVHSLSQNFVHNGLVHEKDLSVIFSILGQGKQWLCITKESIFSSFCS